MTTKNGMYVTTLLAGTLMLSAGAMAEVPQADVNIQSETIKYNPVRAAEAAGAKDLYLKLRRAARMVCGYESGVRQPIEIDSAIAGCVNESMTAAVAKVKIPALTALHLPTGKEGGVKEPVLASR